MLIALTTLLVIVCGVISVLVRRRPGRMPTRWSWQRVSAHDQRAYERATRQRIPAGEYASKVFNQHAPTWCGCCYIVSVVQSVQDKIQIAVAKERGAVPAPLLFDMQRVLNAYNRMGHDDNWNACLGGTPARVVRFVHDARIALTLSTDRNASWKGYPESRNATEGTSSGWTCSRPRMIAVTNYPASVQHEILHDGPVVLNVNGEALLAADSDGLVATDWTDANHAVSVVGWDARRGRAVWIVRNSWGVESAPSQRPENMKECAIVDANTCDPPRRKWTGAKLNRGYVYMPFDTPALLTTPSKWMTFRVRRR